MENVIKNLEQISEMMQNQITEDLNDAMIAAAEQISFLIENEKYEEANIIKINITKLIEAIPAMLGCTDPELITGFVENTTHVFSDMIVFFQK